MVGEWRLHDDGKGGFKAISVTIQSTFSRLNGRHISVTFHSAYFLKIKITPNAARTRDVRIKRKCANHLATGTVRNRYEDLVFM